MRFTFISSLSVHKRIDFTGDEHVYTCNNVRKPKILLCPYTLSVVKHWNGLPGDLIEALSLEALKARLDGALRNLI